MNRSKTSPIHNAPNGKWGAGLVVATILLVGFGIAYRVTAANLHRISSQPIQLPVPLKQFPMELNGWQGRDVEISELTLRIAGNDDFINRLYTKTATDQWASFYVAYTARPRTMLGHRPRICYPAHGWIHKETVSRELTLRSGTTIPCLIHRFSKPAPSFDSMTVLNFYVINGQISSDESVFDGIGWRTPNIEGNVARYVAQIQVSSVLENSALAAATDLLDELLVYLPDIAGDAVEQSEPSP